MCSGLTIYGDVDLSFVSKIVFIESRNCFCCNADKRLKRQKRQEKERRKGEGDPSGGGDEQQNL